jgi:hypothetical protein
MAVATFDTLKFANTLKSAGVPDKQAEAQPVAFSEVVQQNFKDLATKDDLEQLEATILAKTESSANQLRGDLNTLGAQLKGETNSLFATLRGEQITVRWMIGFLLGLCLANLGILIRLLMKG